MKRLSGSLVLGWAHNLCPSMCSFLLGGVSGKVCRWPSLESGDSFWGNARTDDFFPLVSLILFFLMLKVETVCFMSDIKSFQQTI